MQTLVTTFMGNITLNLVLDNMLHFMGINIQ